MRTDDELDHVFLVIEAVEQQGRGGIEGIGQADVGRITLDQVGIIVGAHQLHGFDLEDLQLFGIGDDILFSGLVAHTGFEGDQPGLGQ
ncbi:hypothetical protein D3C76_1461020 [compost metagenome]